MVNCLRLLDRFYVESEKSRIAATKLKEVEKVTNRDVRRLAKDQKAKEVTEYAEGLQNTRGGAKVAWEHGRINIARSRTSRRSKFAAEVRECYIIMTLCGMCSSKLLIRLSSY